MLLILKILASGFIIQRKNLCRFNKSKGFPGGTSGKEPAAQCRRRKRGRLHPWVRKIPWRRAWQPSLVFLPGKPHGQRNLAGYSL